MTQPLTMPAWAEASPDLPPALQQAVQALCDTYDSLDLSIETTTEAAADDFVASLDEMDGCEDALREMVGLLMRDLCGTGLSHGGEPVLLRLAFTDETDLTRQMVALMGDGA